VSQKVAPGAASSISSFSLSIVIFGSLSVGVAMIVL
jgi:hypothetical protein